MDRDAAWHRVLSAGPPEAKAESASRESSRTAAVSHSPNATDACCSIEAVAGAAYAEAHNLGMPCSLRSKGLSASTAPNRSRCSHDGKGISEGRQGTKASNFADAQPHRRTWETERVLRSARRVMS